ncbi:Transcriptional repressor IclR [Baekduia alba]|uniref:IclR family transcriptional regulator n=1 Tax=Baekduia alba TaxID=2997333 RepID=UPI002341F5FC|nr:IclR family transcriptional regulator [Baekduia alba]WCB95359.1 Transcriptional repressor IclR [Baekduia alba]
MAAGEGHASVDRALRVLRVLGSRGGGFTLDELSGVTGIPKSTLHRTLGALKDGGFAAQPVPGGPYTIGVELLAVAFGFYDQLDLRGLVHPLLVRARDRWDETAHVAVLDGADVVYLDKVESRQPLKLSSAIGGRNPAHATGLGKALLAWAYADDDALAGWLERTGQLAARTPRTIVDGAALARELATVRRRGYALESEESELGVRCVAVPIFLGHATPSCALSLAAPAQRMAAADQRAIGDALRTLVDEALGSAHDAGS